MRFGKVSCASKPGQGGSTLTVSVILFAGQPDATGPYLLHSVIDLDRLEMEKVTSNRRRSPEPRQDAERVVPEYSGQGVQSDDAYEEENTIGRIVGVDDYMLSTRVGLGMGTWSCHWKRSFAVAGSS